MFHFGRQYRAAAPNAVRVKKFWRAGVELAPTAFDVDADIASRTSGEIVIPSSMDANNIHACCVMAAQAKFLRRYHALETGQLLNVTDQQIVAAYLSQTGGSDDGLVPDESFNAWVNTGWASGDGNVVRKIAAAARVDATDRADVQLAIWRLGGVLVGGLIPNQWMASFESGAMTPWDVPSNLNDTAGGHEMYAHAYTPTGIIVETWGRNQLITWAAVATVFSEANQGEAFALVRGTDADNPIDGLDTASLLAELAIIREEASR